MSKHTYYARLFMAVSIACGVLLLQMEPTLAGRPSTKKVTKTHVAKVDPDRMAVSDFFEEVKNATARQKKRTPDAGYGFDRGKYFLPETWCIERLKVPKGVLVERCLVRDVRESRLAVLVMVSDCESEMCDAKYWIFSDRRGLRLSPVALDFELVVSPDDRFLYVGNTMNGPDGARAQLTRVDLKTLKTRMVAGCAAPLLSPSKRWIVCRDASGHVHRLSIKGGPLKRVHSINLGKERIYNDAHTGVSLHAVQFIANDRMRIVTLTGDGEERVEEAKWVD